MTLLLHLISLAEWTQPRADETYCRNVRAEKIKQMDKMDKKGQPNHPTRQPERWRQGPPILLQMTILTIGTSPSQWSEALVLCQELGVDVFILDLKGL